MQIFRIIFLLALLSCEDLNAIQRQAMFSSSGVHICMPEIFNENGNIIRSGIICGYLSVGEFLSAIETV